MRHRGRILWVGFTSGRKWGGFISFPRRETFPPIEIVWSSPPAERGPRIERGRTFTEVGFVLRVSVLAEDSVVGVELYLNWSEARALRWKEQL